MRYSKLLGVCLIGVVTLLPVRSLHADEQTIAFLDNEAVPFKWKENGEFVGPLLDIAREAKRRTGIDYKILPMPVKRLLYSVEHGDVLGAIGITYDPNREVYARYVDVPVGWIETHGFVQKDSKIEFKSIEDLYPLRIGVISGYINAYGQPYKDAIASGKIVPHELRGYVSLLEFLLLGRADVIFAPTGPMDALISKNDVTDKVKKLPIPIREAFSLHLMFSRKVSESIPGSADAQKLEAALISMQKEKAIAAIYRKYGFGFIEPE